LTLTSLSIARAQSADLQSLYQAAKSAGETEVVVYLPAAASYKPFFEAFSREFPGIRVASTDIFGAALFARLEAEQASGKPQADVVVSGDIDFPTLTARGWLRAYKPVGIEKLSAEYVGTDGKWVVWALSLVGPVVNANAIKAEGPHSWADLLDPAFRGKVAMTSPTTLTTSPMALVEALDAKIINPKWLDSFAALNPAVLASTSAVMQSVATGQYSVAPFMALIVSDNAKRRGAPVSFWYLKEGNPVVPTSAGVLASAPHPKSAELFASWLLSENSQKISATIGQIGTPPNAPTPPDYPPGTKLFVLTGDAMQKALKDWFAGPAKSLIK
jgi:iron(III) transport system substrate-binding protein